MSTCLLTSSFLSTSARAASFTQLANQIPTLSGFSEAQRKQKWNSYTLQEKQEAWRRAKLTPNFVQAMIDMQTGFTESDLSSSNNKTRHKAKKKKSLTYILPERNTALRKKLTGIFHKEKFLRLKKQHKALK